MQATALHTPQSDRLYQRAFQSMPGGVNSPVRAFNNVGGHPRFIKKAKGAYLYDVDSNRYIDYVGSWGPMILGHAHPAIVEAVKTVAEYGLSFGAPCELEIKLAELIKQHMPSIEKIRMVNSGTEATMSALRLARAATGRAKFIKFDGCYHGHADSFLVNAGSGALTLGTPSSPGVTAGTATDTLTTTFNCLDSVERCFKQHPNEIAAVIVEPISGNMGMILPNPGYLKGLKTLCHQNGALLIFDEVMTGFRVALDGAQGLFDIQPDLTTLGKVIGGGMPVGAYGGRADLMSMIAPEGPVYQAGTLSGNPVAMAAGCATLQQLNNSVYETLHHKTGLLTQGLSAAARDNGIALSTCHQGGMFGFFFSEVDPVQNLEHAKKTNQDFFTSYHQTMLQKGCYFAPSPFEAGFLSTAHSQSDIEHTLMMAKEAMQSLR